MKTSEDLEGRITEFEDAPKNLHKKSHEERFEETGVTEETPEVTAFINSLNNNEGAKKEEQLVQNEEN
jgi:hypothetical protein